MQFTKLAKSFRNEGMDRTHIRVFTAELELYVAYKDYNLDDDNRKTFWKRWP